MALKVMQKIDLREDIKKLMEDTGFVKKVISCENADEAVEVFRAKGVSITLEELSLVYDLIDEIFISAQDGKLDEDELENISGGELITLSAAAIYALIALGGTDISLRVARRVRDKKTDFKNLQTEAEKVGTATYNAVSDKDTQRHEIDNYISTGVGVASVSAALLMLNYYKKDIYKFWHGKKQKMKKSIDINRGKI